VSVYLRRFLNNSFLILFSFFTLSASEVVYSVEADKTLNEGKVKSVSFDKGYTFLNVELSDGTSLDLATANANSPLKVGATVHWRNARKASNYLRQSEGKTYPDLYIVELINNVQLSGVVLSSQAVADDIYIAVKAGQKEHMLVINKRLLPNQLSEGQHIRWTFTPNTSESDKNSTRAESIEIIRKKNK
jgi:hypothetical protein